MEPEFVANGPTERRAGERPQAYYLNQDNRSRRLLTLFRARMELEGRYKEFVDLSKELKEILEATQPSQVQEVYLALTEKTV